MAVGTAAVLDVVYWRNSNESAESDEQICNGSLPHWVLTHWRILERSTGGRTRRRQTGVLPMLYQRNQARFFQRQLCLTTGIVIRSLIDLLVEHFEKVLLTRRNVSARDQREGKEFDFLFNKMSDGHSRALKNWSVFSDHGNHNVIARVAVRQLLHIIVDDLLLFLIIFVCEENKVKKIFHANPFICDSLSRLSVCCFSSSESSAKHLKIILSVIAGNQSGCASGTT